MWWSLAFSRHDDERLCKEHAEVVAVPATGGELGSGALNEPGAVAGLGIAPAMDSQDAVGAVIAVAVVRGVVAPVATAVAEVGRVVALDCVAARTALGVLVIFLGDGYFGHAVLSVARLSRRLGVR